MLPKAVREEIVNVLNNKIHKLECPMCKNKKFTLIDGYFCNTLQNSSGVLSVGEQLFAGRNVPVASIVCQHCGFLSQHSLGVLGLMPKKEDGADDKNK